MIQIPPFLQTSDTIALISPSGVIPEDTVLAAAARLQEWGYSVKIYPSALSDKGRFAGDDSQRAADLQDALNDPSIHAILCNRGGYGSVRIIDRIDWSGFLQHPKWLIGFSDITIWHSAVHRLNVASLHAPMSKHIAQYPSDTVSSFTKDILQGRFPSYQQTPHSLNQVGTVTGTLFGGNLSVLCGLRGTPYDFSPKGKILFLEDVGEYPYRIDRMFHNLQLGDVLSQISGLIIGQFSETQEDDGMPRSIYQEIARMVERYKYPVCFDFPVGHTRMNLPMICGATVEFSVQPEGSLLRFISA